MIVKVCGTRDGDNIRQVAELGVQWIGLIFWQGSPRQVTMVPTHAGIMPDRAGGELTAPRRSYKLVGVFVDDMPQNIITRVVAYGLDMVQLHGHETPTMIRNLRATLVPDMQADLQLIKAISISTAADLSLCDEYADCVDFFLFDTKCESVGGSGRHFDWSVLDAYRGQKPYLLSGGIGPDDAEDVRRFVELHPQCVGIDLNSRFETAPGQKDVELLRHFMHELPNSSTPQLLNSYEQDKPAVRRT